MFNFSNLKNRPVLAKDNLCILGNVEDCIFVKGLNQIEYFLCKNSEDDFLLSLDNFTAINDALVVDDSTLLKHLEDVDFTSLTAHLNKAVYSDDGRLAGVVSDLSFELSGRVKQILLDNGTLKASDIAGVGEIVLLKPQSKRRKRTKPTSLVALAKEDKPVTILGEGSEKEAIAMTNTTAQSADNCVDDMSSTPSTDSLENAVSQHQEQGVPFVVESQPVPIVISPNVTIAEAPQPPRIISDYNFLLGRTLTSDLYTFEGELIAYKNTSVTVAVVDKARLNGKLLELTYQSK